MNNERKYSEQDPDELERRHYVSHLSAVMVSPEGKRVEVVITSDATQKLLQAGWMFEEAL